MSNSPLVNYTKISPNKSSPRKNVIDTITIHMVAGNCSVETIGDIFAPTSRQASSNYGIGSDGRVGMYVEEKDRSWCSSSSANDNRAITIEVANDGGAPEWHVSDAAMAKLIELCVDICKRNNITKLNYTGNKTGNLTMHCWFSDTSCPGNYLKRNFPNIASEVNKRLTGKVYPVAPTNHKFVTGDLVSIKTGAKYYGGQSIPSWVMGQNWYVSNVEGDKVIIDQNESKSNSIASPIHDYDLNIVKAVNPTPTPVKRDFIVGDLVSIKSGAKYYNGVSIPSWVTSQNWYVSKVDGDMVVIDKNETGTNSIASPVHDYDLTLVRAATPVCAHSKYNIVGAKAATCTAEGYTGDKVCTSCGKKIEVGKRIAKLNHRPGIAATCTSSQICADCGAVLVKALGHQYVDSVVAPTCVEKGYTKHTCSRCGESYIDSYVDAKGHVPGEAADCNHDQNCTVCGAKLAGQLGHNYEDIFIDPTCTKQGYTHHKCSRCGDSYLDTYIDALGHNYVLTGEKEPTVEAEGYTGDKVCSRCKDTIKGEIISKLPTPEPQPSQTEKNESIAQKIIKIIKWLLSLFKK